MLELPVHNVQAIRIFLHLLVIFIFQPKSSLNCLFSSKNSLKWPILAEKGLKIAVFVLFWAISTIFLQKTVHENCHIFGQTASFCLIFNSLALIFNENDVSSTGHWPKASALAFLSQHVETYRHDSGRNPNPIKIILLYSQ